METPKPKGGRPRRAAWSAHDARRISRQVEIAHAALRRLGYMLAEYPEVALAMNAGTPEAFAWYVTTTNKTESALREMRAVVISKRAAEWRPADGR